MQCIGNPLPHARYTNSATGDVVSFSVIIASILHLTINFSNHPALIPEDSHSIIYLLKKLTSYTLYVVACIYSYHRKKKSNKN